MNSDTAVRVVTDESSRAVLPNVTIIYDFEIPVFLVTKMYVFKNVLAYCGSCHDNNDFELTTLNVVLRRTDAKKQ